MIDVPFDLIECTRCQHTYVRDRTRTFCLRCRCGNHEFRIWHLERQEQPDATLAGIVPATSREEVAT